MLSITNPLDFQLLLPLANEIPSAHAWVLFLSRCDQRVVWVMAIEWAHV